MTIASAESFIRQVISTPALVQRLNAAPDRAAIKEIISELGPGFDTDQFQQAYFNLLTHCQADTQAELIKEVKLWWDYLEFTLSSTE